MRILVVTNLYPPAVLGGYEILCAQVVNRLRDRHEVTVLTSDHGTTPDTAAQAHVLRSLRLYRPFGLPPAILRAERRATWSRNREAMRRVLATARPDVVFAWSQLRLTLGALRAAQDAGVPVVYTLNDEGLASWLPARWEARARALVAAVLDRTVFREITLDGLDLSWCTSISRSVRDNLVARGVPVGGARIIPQGIPLERFPLKEHPGRLGHPLRLLYAGQLHAYKGVHTVLSAVDRVARERGPDVLELTVAGDGPDEYRQRLEDQAASSPARVTFAGWCPHDAMPQTYRAHDAFVFPSEWQEPFGLTHLEAMASGLPVVSTNDGGHGEFLEHDGNALVFQKGDAADLARQLCRLLDEPGLAPGLAARARAQVEREFTVDRYTAALEALLAEASASSKASAGHGGEGAWAP